MLLILAVLWAVILVPPILRARAESRPSGSITDFRRQLRVLARATPGGATALVPPHAAPRRARVRRSSARRRRDILCGLLVVIGGSLVLGILPPLRMLWLVHVIADVLLVAYIAALLYVRNIAAEREMKVRFLPTARTPEPALLLRRSAN